ncbi:MAG: AtpZ/AtpI family protein [Candidatus Sulfotelmatobacter sp.]|jgi:ATP synthase protein I
MSPPNPTEEPENSQGRENFWVQVARYTQLALVFPAAVVVGWLIGAALDRWLHTTWLYLAGILFGIAAGFIELIRAFMRDAK